MSVVVRRAGACVNRRTDAERRIDPRGRGRRMRTSKRVVAQIFFLLRAAPASRHGTSHQPNRQYAQRSRPPTPALSTSDSLPAEAPPRLLLGARFVAVDSINGTKDRQSQRTQQARGQDHSATHIAAAKVRRKARAHSGVDAPPLLPPFPPDRDVTHHMRPKNL